MFMKDFVARIYGNKIRCCVTLIVLLLPVFDIVIYCCNLIRSGGSTIAPAYGTFLASNTTDHLVQIILLWFLPLYTLVITGEGPLEDRHRGYHRALMGRMGRNAYYTENIKCSFVFVFFLVSIALLINLGLVSILCHGGKYIPIEVDDSPENLLYNLSNAHPFLANLGFIFVTAFLAGLISTVGTALALVTADRKIVYAMAFFLWFVPTSTNSSLLLVMQPFAEYDFETLLPIFLIVTAGYLILIRVLCFWKIRVSALE